MLSLAVLPAVCSDPDWGIGMWTIVALLFLSASALACMLVVTRAFEDE